MATFRRSRHGLYSLTLQPTEADVLASLAREVLELLDVPGHVPGSPVDPLQAELGLSDLPAFDALEDAFGGLAGDALDGGVGSGPTSAPEDEVLRRLLPDAYGDADPDASAEFRRFTERGLRERKAAAARAVLATLAPVEGQGGRVQLDDDGARTWLGALNDIRLALGTRLGVSDEEDVHAGLAEDDPARWAWAVYDFATHLQETLVRSLR